MFDSLDEQLKRVESQESTTKERILRYIGLDLIDDAIAVGLARDRRGAAVGTGRCDRFVLDRTVVVEIGH